MTDLSKTNSVNWSYLLHIKGMGLRSLSWR